MNLVFSALSLIITAFLIDKLHDAKTILFSGVVIISFAGAGNILNDIFDYSIDKINRPYRPLPSKEIAGRLALIVMISLFLIGIIFSFLLEPLALIIALGMVLPLLIIYTPILKKIPIVGNMAIASILGLVFIFSEASLTGETTKMWIPAFLAFGLSWVRELAKDMQDIVGDKQNNVRTFPVRYGISLSVTFYGFLAGLLSILAMLPIMHHIYGYPYFILLIVGVIVPLMLSVYYLKNHQTPNECGKVASLLKIITVVGLIVILSTGF